MAITNFTKECTYNLDNKKQVVGCFYDMSKAFDTIAHDILFKKLEHYGFDQKAVSLIKSYLFERFQCVFYNGSFSNYLQVHTGVPQGSILGPTMFIIYVNDLPVALNNPCISSYMYADDLAIQIGCSDGNLVSNLLCNFNLVIEDWTAANCLCLNKGKTQTLKFNLSNCDTVEIKFLGVFLQHNLKWSTHIADLCKKICKGIFMLRRIKLSVSLDVLLSVYFAHIQSHLSYGIIVWGCDRNIKKLLLLQKRALRIMCNVSSRTHCKPLFKMLNVLTVPSLYLLDLLLYIRSNLNTIPVNSSVHSHFTRQENFLRVNQCNYSATINSSFELGKRIFNMLSLEIKSLEVKKFKLYLRTTLLELCIYDIEEFIEYLAQPNGNCNCN